MSVRTALRLGALLGGATLALIVLLATRALPTERALSIWVVLVTAIALRELVLSFPRDSSRRPRFEAALRRRETAPPVPSVFAGMERELELATAFADHAHRRLLPRLRAAAAARLALRHGIELERRPDVAQRLLGETTWDLLRPDRPEPTDRFGPGLPREEIAAVIECIEAL